MISDRYQYKDKLILNNTLGDAKQNKTPVIIKEIDLPWWDS